MGFGFAGILIPEGKIQCNWYNHGNLVRIKNMSEEVCPLAEVIGYCSALRGTSKDTEQRSCEKSKFWNLKTCVLTCY